MPVKCSICKEELFQAGSTVSSTPCGHVLHSQCLMEWIETDENSGNCPSCLENFEPFNVIPLLTLDDMEGLTSSANNQQFDELKMELKDTQMLLKSVMDLCNDANQQISMLKKQVEIQERQNANVEKPITFEQIKKWCRDKISEFLWPL